jgi:PIN domain nuclease of toxin-antitoxin system
VDLEQRREGPSLPPQTGRVIPLDTNALVWLDQGHRRARPLVRGRRRLYLSPASLLEIQFLTEAGRTRLRPGHAVSGLADDERWLLDDPPAAAWFDRAMAIGWTGDPFDRLLVAHAGLRGWRLATGDRALIERLGPARCVPL